mmetsp:Transcript_20935/g.41782  ORF Transcript_20935/g.41782 Transcript_20935/m.41782 type:complete len:380 (-) Transcript_20935:174-1313(-)
MCLEGVDIGSLLCLVDEIARGSVVGLLVHLELIGKIVADEVAVLVGDGSEVLQRLLLLVVGGIKLLVKESTVHVVLVDLGSCLELSDGEVLLGGSGVGLGLVALLATLEGLLREEGLLEGELKAGSLVPLSLPALLLTLSHLEMTTVGLLSLVQLFDVLCHLLKMVNVLLVLAGEGLVPALLGDVAQLHLSEQLIEVPLALVDLLLDLLLKEGLGLGLPPVRQLGSKCTAKVSTDALPIAVRAGHALDAGGICVNGDDVVVVFKLDDVSSRVDRGHSIRGLSLQERSGVLSFVLLGLRKSTLNFRRGQTEDLCHFVGCRHTLICSQLVKFLQHRILSLREVSAVTAGAGWREDGSAGRGCEDHSKLRHVGGKELSELQR